MTPTASRKSTVDPLDWTAVERVPRDDGAETAVIGALLEDDEQGSAYEIVFDKLTASDFFGAENAEIIRTIASLREGGKRPDFIVLRDRLVATGRLEAIGGEEYLASIVETFPVASNVAAHSDLIRQLALRRRLIEAGRRMMRSGIEPGGRTIEEILDEHQGAILELDTASASSGPVPVCSVVEEVLRDTRDTGHPPISTGFLDLDRQLVGGMRRGELLLCAARPSVGKSALAFGVALSASLDRDRSVAFFSLEMDRKAATRRFLAARAGVPLSVLQPGSFSKPNTENYRRLAVVHEELRAARLFVDDSSSLTVHALRSRTRRLKGRHGIDLVVVDFLQLMSAGGESRVQEVGQIVRGLKALAKDLDVPVFALSQLSRAPELRGGDDKRPRLPDLRDTGELEQAADVVLFIYRPAYHDPTAARAGGREHTAEIIVAKSRNGPTGTVEVRFDGPLARFESLSRRG